MGACFLFWASGALAGPAPGPPSVFTPVAGSPFENATTTVGVAFSPSGGLLATAHPAFDAVVVFSVGAGGVLTPAGSAALTAGSGPSSVAFSPINGLLASSNAGNNSVSVFSVTAGGVLTPVGSAVPTGAGPSSVAFSSNCGLLATANAGNGRVSVFSVSADGALTEVPGSPYAVGQARAVAFSQHGNLLAVGRPAEGSTVAVFSVSTGGGLTQVAGSPYPSGDAPRTVAFSPNGHLLATANFFSNDLSEFQGGAPNVQISAPADQQTYTESQSVSTSFACTDPPGAGGISSCTDSGGASSPTGTLDTSTLGAHTYTATATSSDGLTATSAISYTVIAVPPAKTTATTPTTNPTPAAAPTPISCLTPSGRLTKTQLGPISLGMTRATARQTITQSKALNRYTDNLCLAGGYGIRVGYATQAMTRSEQLATRLKDRIVFATSANPYYSLQGIRPGMGVTALPASLHLEPAIHIGPNTWYVTTSHNLTDVIKARGGLVQEVGILNHQMTTTRAGQIRLLRNF
jgi:6-phosphogluconolactonase (cycloisomerase 2 family)